MERCRVIDPVVGLAFSGGDKTRRPDGFLREEQMDLVLAVFFMAFSAGCLTGTCVGLWWRHQQRDMAVVPAAH